MSTRYPWLDVIEQARAAKGRWCLPTAMQGAPLTAVRAIIDRRSPDLHLDDGRIEADPTSIHTTDDGKKHCDVWVRFVPKEK